MVSLKPLLIFLLIAAFPSISAIAQTPPPVNEELTFIGTVTDLLASPVPKSTQNWLVSTKIDAAESDAFIGRTVQFRIHSPVKAGIVVGHRYRFYATKVGNLFTIDELKIEPQK